MMKSARLVHPDTQQPTNKSKKKPSDIGWSEDCSVGTIEIIAKKIMSECNIQSVVEARIMSESFIARYLIKKMVETCCLSYSESLWMEQMYRAKSLDNEVCKALKNKK